MLTNFLLCGSLRKVVNGHAEDSRYRYSGIRKQRLPRKRVDDCNGFIRNLSSLCLRREVFYIRLQLWLRHRRKLLFGTELVFRKIYKEVKKWQRLNLKHL